MLYPVWSAHWGLHWRWLQSSFGSTPWPVFTENQFSNTERYILKKEMLGMWLVDIWRTLNKNTREYSFYSPVHNRYTRIDLLLMPSSKVHQVTSCEYLAKTLSDHVISHNTCIHLPVTWRNIDSFFKINQNTANLNTVWDAMKARLRGQIIAYTSGKRKEYGDRILWKIITRN